MGVQSAWIFVQVHVIPAAPFIGKLNTVHVLADILKI